MTGTASGRCPMLTVTHTNICLAHKWQVWTTTGSEPNQGTSSLVVLVLYGDKGHTEPMVIGNTTQLTFRFTEGETQEFEV